MRNRAAVTPVSEKLNLIGAFMKWKLLVTFLACAAFFASNAKAQDEEKIDIYAGYSYLRANPSSNTIGGFGLNGGNASLAYHVTPWLSGVADFGGYTNSNVFHTGSSGTASNLFGTTQSHNAFAAALGGGFDFRLNRHFSLRPLEVDYLPTRFPEVGFGRQTQDNLRASTGIVFHF
jgi:hypothetical protein